MNTSAITDHVLRLNNGTHHMKSLARWLPRYRAAAVRARLPDAGPALSWQKQERKIPSIVKADHTELAP